jgi:hypothetical protein
MTGAASVWGSDLARQAWSWGLATRDAVQQEVIARAHGRKEWWGRLVKRPGLVGAFDADGAQELRPVYGGG